MGLRLSYTDEIECGIDDDPVDHIEPHVEDPLKEAYREAAQAMARNLDHVVGSILTVHPRIPHLWGLAFALDLPFLDGRSMRSVERSHGISAEIISQYTQRYVTQLGLEGSSYQRGGRKPNKKNRWKRWLLN